MPVQSAKQAVKQATGRIRAASAAVRECWTQQEADRRREMADVMQQHLIEALGLQTAPVRKIR